MWGTFTIHICCWWLATYAPSKTTLDDTRNRPDILFAITEPGFNKRDLMYLKLKIKACKQKEELVWWSFPENLKSLSPLITKIWALELMHFKYDVINVFKTTFWRTFSCVMIYSFIMCTLNLIILESILVYRLNKKHNCAHSYFLYAFKATYYAWKGICGLDVQMLLWQQTSFSDNN